LAAAGAVLLVTDLSAAKGVFTVGPGGGASSIRDLGFKPQAVLAWWSRQDVEGVVSGNAGGLGFWTSTATAAVAWSSKAGSHEMRAAHIADEAAVLGLASEPPAVTMSADLVSMDADGFTLHWTKEPSETWILHYLALGGGSLKGARVGWTASPSEPGRLNPDVSGLAPDLILFAPTGAPSLSTPVAGLVAGIGAACVRNQAAAVYVAPDRAPAGAVGGTQRTDAAVVTGYDRTALAGFAKARLRPSQRLELDWSSVPPARSLTCFLALEGVRCRLGTCLAPGGPASVRTRLGFRPEALLLFSWGRPASQQPVRIGRLCVGGASAHQSGCAGWDDAAASGPHAAHAFSSTSSVLIVTDTPTGGRHAAATLEKIDDRGFTLGWTESDRASREIVYVALAAKPREGLIARTRNVFAALRRPESRAR
jgi:hypothetical protein